VSAPAVQRTPADHATTFDARVADVVARGAEASPAFRDRLAAAGVEADGVRGVADLDRLPVQSKDDLLELQRAAPPFGRLLAGDVRPRRVFQSPGPLYEPDLDDGDGWRWATALRAAGFTAMDRVIVTFGFHLSPAGAMFEAACHRLGATVLPAGVGTKDLQVQACADLGVTAYVGTPSYLKALLDAADDAGTELRIERAFVTAEPLPPSLRQVLEARVPIVRQGFGTAETGHLGHECAARDGWHVPDDALVQVCDLSTGAALGEDEEGQIVVTLFDPRYPVVRFGTGDLSAWHPDPCTCGATTPRLRGWLGRVGDAVKVRGMFLHPRQVDSVLSQVPGVERYRLVVERHDHRDHVLVQVVATTAVPDVADRTAVAVRDGLRFRAEVELVDELPDGHPVLDDRRSWR
jgi:phenylacetate-CoA ligase